MLDHIIKKKIWLQESLKRIQEYQAHKLLFLYLCQNSRFSRAIKVSQLVG